MLRIDVISIFPDMFRPIIHESIIKRGVNKKKIQIHLHDLRDYTLDKHKKVDDRPFGGGPGMIMTPQPLIDAVKNVKGRRKTRVIFLCPGGKPFNQKHAKRLSKVKNIILVCGRYEGIDDRVKKAVIDESISIGDYVLTGGEIPAMVVMDAVIRLVPGVLGKEESLVDESFENGLLEYPQYTRPAKFRGKRIPAVLLTGDHARIKKWRKQQAESLTKRKRPDLIS